MILACRRFANNAFGVLANLSTFQWFRIATHPPEVIGTETEITNVDRSASVFLPRNTARLIIRRLRISNRTGVNVGTEAAYKCRACVKLSPEPLRCEEATISITAHSELPTCVYLPVWLDMLNGSLYICTATRFMLPHHRIVHWSL